MKKNNYNIVEFKWFQDPRYNRNLKWYRKDDKTGDTEWDTDPVVGERGEVAYDEKRWKRLEREGWKPTSPWYENMCKTFNNDEQKIAQELDVSFLGSSDNVIPVNVIEHHMKSNVVDVTKIDGWDLWDPFVNETWIWKDPIPGHRYVCCVDASSGAADDRTAIEMIDIDAVDEETGRPYFDQVLEYYGKRTGDDIGEMVYEYATAYNNALVVVAQAPMLEEIVNEITNGILDHAVPASKKARKPKSNIGSTDAKPQGYKSKPFKR